MNHTYRLLWSDITHTFVAVAEFVKGRGKRNSGVVGHPPTARSGKAAIFPLNMLAVSVALIGAPAHALDVNALPTGGQVSAGQATINAVVNNTLTINQTSQRAVFDWQSFNIGASAAVNFIQPNSSSVALNRISGEASQIYGKLTATGQVFFMNPNGMLFARGSQVNVGGILATTLNISNADFMAGGNKFTNPGSGTIRNEGILNASGSVALVGNTVENAGTIIATTATLAAGDTVAIDLTGDGLIRARVDNPALRSRIENSGSINATVVTMTAGQSREMMDSLVNNAGIVRATGLAMQGGEIILEGGGRIQNAGTIDASSAQGKGGSVQLRGRDIDFSADSSMSAAGKSGGGTIIVLGDMQSGSVNVAGTLDASSTNGDGGFIETSAAHVNVADNAKVTTASAMGLTGSWLIDPVDYTIAASGGNMTGAALTTSLASTNVSILSTNGTTGTAGDVNVNDVVAWSANKLTLNAQNNININANLNGSGTASLALEYGQQAVAAGNISDYKLANGVQVNLAAGNNFSTKLGSNGTVRSYTVITSLGAAGSTTAADLQGMSGGLAGNYVLGSNIDASATSAWNSGAGFAPVGNSSTKFTGAFDGLGHTVSTLTINRSSTDYIGLFGYADTGSSIRNVGMVGGSVSGGNYVGGLVGGNSGTVTFSYATGSVSGSGTNSRVGGLVGMNSEGMISNAHATGSVGGAGTNSKLGGLVGYNYGTVSNSYATGAVSGAAYAGGLVGFNSRHTISNSYATGSVSGGSYVGGLVGRSHFAAISNSYATGNVGGASYVGGLAGMSYGTDAISNTYSIGSVSGTGSYVGGLIGRKYGAGTVTNSYWNTTTSGKATSSAGTGLTTAQMQSTANFTGFTFTTTPGAAGWVMVNGDGSLNGSATGGTTPMLASEYSTTINNAHQLQLMAMAPAASYTLGSNIDAARTASSTDAWGSSGFVPVGNLTTNFTGTFDGLGHTISNLTINRPTTNYVGLFGDAGTGSIIKNVGLVGGSVSGLAYVGELIGINMGASVSNSYATGNVSGTGIGVGGLVGGNSIGTVSNSYATGTVTSTSSSVGGLVGSNNDTISNSYATGSVSGTASVGGLVGNSGSGSTISNSYATGSVNGSASSVGGLLGNLYSGSITGSYATGNVSGSTRVGGLVGNNSYGTISNSHATGNVSGSSWDSYVGGLIGYNITAGTVNNSYATGSVSGTNYIGGLVGYNAGNSVSNSHATGNVSAAAGYVGGLVGRHDAGAVTNSYATGSVGGAAYSGGLVGWGSTGSTISNSYATGAVTGSVNANTFAGGLVGYLQGALSNSYSSGNVSAAGLAIVGGLVGAVTSTGTVSNSYATGSVTAADKVGGLVGSNMGTVDTSYSTGAVSASTSVGGLVGLNSGSINSSYWNTTTSGQASSAGGTGLSTAQMQSTANFTGFTFTATPGATGNNWVIVDGDGTLNNASGAAGATFPMLASEYSTTISNAHQLQLMEMAPAASYTLGTNIDASKTATSTDVWGSTGFVPVGNSTTTFTGTFDGQGHTISNLTINMPTTNNVGLFGWAGTGSVIKNVGLVGGGVTGALQVGDLVAVNFGAVSNSYSTGTVSGTRYVGGLVGGNFNSGATVTNSYATGSVSGTIDSVGGLVGQNNGGTVNNSYATGSVSGTSSYAGGLVGGNFGTVNNSYWSSGVNLTGVGGGTGAVTNTSGLTSSGMMQTSSFSSWSIANTGGSGAVWRIYEGHTAPLLTSFMTGLTLADAVDAAVTYNGTAQSGTTTAIAGVLGAAATGTNAGFYNGYYSTQQGYDITGGNLTISPKALTVTGTTASNKVYDGTTAVTLTGGSLAGVIGGDTVTLTQAGAFASKNVGTGISITVADALGGSSAANYTITQPTGLSANITQLASVSWVGGATGNWSTAANWTGGALPDGANVAAVSIPSGKTVTYDSGVVGATTLNALTSSGSFVMAAGTLSLNGSSTISAYSQTGGTLNFAAGTSAITNANVTAGTIGLSGGTLNMAGAWSNAGTFNETAGTLNLGGTFTTAGLGTFSRTGGSVNLTGTLDLSGGSLDVGNAGLFGTGGLNSFSGTIKNGTITSTNATPTLTGSGAFLDGVTIGSNLNASGGFNIANGLTLGDGVTLNKDGSHWYFDGYYNGGKPAGTVHHLSTLGTSTFNSAGGSIFLISTNAQTLQIDSGVTVQGTGSLDIAHYAASTLINNGTIIGNDAGGLGLYAGLFTNNGTVTNTAGTMTVNPTSFTNNGIVNVTNGSLNLGVAPTLGASGKVNLSAGTSLTIAGNAYTVINSLGVAGDATSTSLQGMKNALSGRFVLGSDIDATATSAWNAGAGFVPVGDGTTQFTGTFDGLGHTVSNLQVNQPTSNYVGLFGYAGTGSVIRNLGLVGSSVAGGANVGSLVGRNLGAISNTYATGNVTASSNVVYAGYRNIGGLVGYNGGTISTSYAMGNVSSTATTNNYQVGGLVGENYGAINNSYATGDVAGQYSVGGLIGANMTGGTVSNSYATGSVSGTSEIAGLVGWNASGATITNSYATGQRAGGWNIGGLVGNSGGGVVANSFWNSNSSFTGTTAGLSVALGGTGLTTAQMQSTASFTGFTFTTTPGATGNNWVMVNGNGSLNGTTPGGTYPMLASEYSTTITNAHQLQLMAMAPAANYTLDGNVDAAKTANSTDVWGSAGFVPVGNSTTPFTGNFNGLGDTISGLTINRPTNDFVALFGQANGATLQNFHLTSLNVTGRDQTAGVAGYTPSTTISQVSSSGSINGNREVGGLVGSRAFGTLSGSYSTATVTGTGDRVGGVVGINYFGTISDVYSTGDVTGGTLEVGGLVGLNYSSSTISNSYSIGAVSGASSFGGLVGVNLGAVTNSYWNTQTSDQPASAGGTGLTTAQMQQMSSFSGWNIARTGGSGATWRIYEGHTAPLLTSFLTPLTLADAPDVAVSYNGTAQNGAATANAGVLGTAASGANAGFYNGYYSTQQGYDITGGNLTVNAATLSISLSGTRAYDGTNIVDHSIFALSGLAGDQTLALTGVGTVADPNVGANKPVALGSLALGDGSNGGLASNYTFTGGTQVATIIPAPLAVTANAASKVYDGLAYSGGNGVAYSGFVNSETSVVLGGALAYGGSSQGAVNTGDYSIIPGGLTSSNYTLSFIDGQLTISLPPATTTTTTTQQAAQDAATSATQTVLAATSPTSSMTSSLSTAPVDSTSSSSTSQEGNESNSTGVKAAPTVVASAVPMLAGLVAQRPADPIVQIDRPRSQTLVCK